MLELDLDGKLIKKHTVLEGLNAASVRKVLKDEHGNLCIETRGLEYNTQIYKDGKWVGYNGFTSRRVELINQGNNLLGYLDNSNDSICVKTKTGWKSYWHVNDGVGIKNNVVYDNDGNLWVGRQGGVIKYGRGNAKYYDFVPQHNTNCGPMLKDKNGVLWIFSFYVHGWLQYDKEKDNWLKCDSDVCQEIGFASLGYVDAKQNLWFVNGNKKMLYHYDGQALKNIKIPIENDYRSTSPSGISTITEDTEGNIWLASYQGKLYQYNGQDWTVMDLPNRTALDRRIDLVFKDKKSNIWMIADKGICSIGQDKKQVFGKKSLCLKEDRGIQRLRNPIEGAAGNFYFTPGAGVCQYNPSNQEWDYYLDQYNVRSVYYNNSTQEMNYLTDKGFLIQESADGKRTYHNVLTEAKDKETLSGSDCYWDKKGGLWFWSIEKLYYWTPTNLLVFDSSNMPLEYTPNWIFEDSKGRLWMNIKEGVACWDGKRWEVFNRENSHLGDYRTSIWFDDYLPIAEKNQVLLSFTIVALFFNGMVRTGKNS